MRNGKDNPKMGLHRFKVRPKLKYEKPPDEILWRMFEAGVLVHRIADGLKSDRSYVYRRIQAMQSGKAPKPVPVKEFDSKSIMAYIERYQHDEDFEPQPASQPTTEQPGSKEKIEVLRNRAQMGQELWHPKDLVCFRDRTGFGHRDGLIETSSFAVHRPRKGLGTQ